MSHSEPTLQEQTFRDELEKILAEFIGYPKEDDITGGFDQALTSIINLVDRDIIGSDSDPTGGRFPGEKAQDKLRAKQRNKLKEK